MLTNLSESHSRQNLENVQERNVWNGTPIIFISSLALTNRQWGALSNSYEEQKTKTKKFNFDSWERDCQVQLDV